MSKPFKTNSQQLKILRSRNLITCQNCNRIGDKTKSSCSECEIKIINHKALRILEKENYYSLINWYNELFLYPHQVTKDGIKSEDAYRNGSSIFEIYELYLLDKKLRTILLQELLKYEHYLKTKCAYFFCEENKEPHAYLNYTNYEGESRDIINTINYITRTLSEKNKKKSPINHYIEGYESIPLWVIVNHFTFGNIRYFYDVCSKEVKIKIARSFNKQFEREYPHYKGKVKIDECVLMLMNIIVNLYRNSCAHNERVYNMSANDFSNQFNQKKYKGQVRIPKEHLIELSDALNIQKSAIKNGGIFSMLIYLKLFISKEDYVILINNIDKSLDETLSRIHTVSRERLLQNMGFTGNTMDWKEKLLS